MPPIPAMVLRYAATRVCANVVGIGAGFAARGISSAAFALQQAALRPATSGPMSCALQGAAAVGSVSSQAIAGLGHVLTGR